MKTAAQLRGALPVIPRVTVMGPSGSGKTTLARRLSEILGIPHIEVEALAVDPGWRAVATPLLRERVAVALAGDRWICDGGYNSGIGDIALRRANAVVWLDYPLSLVLFRLLRRTAWRVLARERLSHGNREGLTAFARRGSAFLRTLRNHRKRRREYAAMLAAPAYRHLVVVRLSGPAQVETWLSALAGEPDALPPLNKQFGRI